MIELKGTRVYGASDDLIEFEGDLKGEVCAYQPDDSEDDLGTLVAFSDGTILSIRYGKPGLGVWAITPLRQGDLFDHFEICNDDDAKPNSDVAYFRPGPLKAWVFRRSGEPVNENYRG